MYTLEQNLKQFRSKERAEFEDALDREEEDKRLAPIRAAQAEQSRLLTQIHDAEKQEVLAGRLDPGFTVPESVAGKRMSIKEASEFNSSEGAKFKANTPEFYPSNKNIRTLLDYLLQQNVYIADEATFRAAFERLRSLGLLEERPTEPEPVTVMQSETQQSDPDAERERKRQEYFTKPVVNYAGKDYSQADLDRLSADEYRRVVGLYGENLPRFSNVMQASR